jgi:hypothetical protein
MQQGAKAVQDLEQVELDRHRDALVADARKLVEKYRKIFDWDVPPHHGHADWLTLVEIRAALAGVEEDLKGGSSELPSRLDNTETVRRQPHPLRQFF